MFKTNSTIIILLLFVTAMLSASVLIKDMSIYKNNQQKFNNNENQQNIASVTSPKTTAKPTPEPSIQPIVPDQYQLVDKNQITKIDVTYSLYTFRKGQVDEGSTNHSNYDLVFPSTWKVYSYTNDEMYEDHGTNVLLLKDKDTITIKQQLYESGTCVFENEPEFGMSYLCDLKEVAKNETENLKIYTISEYSYPDEKNSMKKTSYGVCDQDDYSNSVSEFRTPEPKDYKICSPWTKFGEINFNTDTTNPSNYDDFVYILNNLKVVPVK